VTTVDYLVVGAGLTGSTIARRLQDNHREVLVLDRRPHRGGNVHDTTTPSGLRIHSYGPHYFRCSSPRIWDFVRRFAEFDPFSAEIQCRVHDRYEPWPIHRGHFAAFPDWESHVPTSPPSNFEEACLRKMPRPIYDLYVRGYTQRQWGVDPIHLNRALADRIRINEPHQTTLTPHHRHQGLPRHGYASFMDAMLDGIDCRLDVDFHPLRTDYHARRALIFTGPIDEFFGFDWGRLQYRGQQRVHQTVAQSGLVQPCPQVNYPNAAPDHPIRTIEWKHLLPIERQATLTESIITGEFPFTPTDPHHFEYPFPDAENQRLAERYRTRAKSITSLVICGRLGEYRYLDMDQAIGRALTLADKLLRHPHP
jgi:UDP-galactopyranose mutase